MKKYLKDKKSSSEKSFAQKCANEYNQIMKEYYSSNVRSMTLDEYYSRKIGTPFYGSNHPR
jgi:hypothetical protein